MVCYYYVQGRYNYKGSRSNLFRDNKSPFKLMQGTSKKSRFDVVLRWRYRAPKEETSPLTLLNDVLSPGRYFYDRELQKLLRQHRQNKRQNKP